MKRWLAGLPAERIQQWLGAAVASMLVTSIASVGQVQHALGARRGRGTTTVAAGTTGTDGGEGAGTTSTTLPPLPGSEPPVTARGTTARGVSGTKGGAGGGALAGLPDFGLRTQGVTDKTVRIGTTYNVTSCGDAAALNSMFGVAVSGDPQKAYDAFVRNANDHGGIAGRQLILDTGDDGGSGCPEKEQTAARKLVDDDKDFVVIPGLHSIADYAISRKVPVFGGRDDPQSLVRIGANGVMLTEPLQPTFAAWSSFGANYIDTAHHSACLFHPTSDVSGDWDNYEKVLVAEMAKQHLKFTDIIVYENTLATARDQANTAVTRAKAECDQAWMLSGNPIAWVFFTQAATENLWFPLWTFTSYSVLADSELGGRLMDQQQWQNAVGLSSRVKPGEHPAENHCKDVYERYYPNDGQSGSASVYIACAQVMSVTEIMRRAVARTGVLTGNSYLIGANSVRNDFYYDAHVPITWSFPGAGGPFKTKGFDHLTVVKWNRAAAAYDFPEYPSYWRVMGPRLSGGEDLRPKWQGYKVHD